MNMALLAIFIPFAAIPILALLGGTRVGRLFGVLVSLACWVVTLLVAWQGQGAQGLIRPGPVQALFGAVAGFSGVAASLAIFMAPISLRPRLQQGALQAVIGASLVGLYEAHAPLLWLAMEAGVMALACMSFAAGHRAAALKTLVLGSVGAELALFGSLLVLLAGVAGAQGDSLLPLALILGVGGCFLQIIALSGVGPVPSIAAGALLNVPLLAVLRFRHVDQAVGGPLLLALAVVVLLGVAFCLRRRQAPMQVLGLASLQQAGVVLFAFGLGGVWALFAGMLHMLLTSLLKTGLFAGFSFASASKQVVWLRAALLFALVGLPPSGLFVSEFIIVQQTYVLHPWLCVPLALALVGGAWPLLRWAQRVAGEKTVPTPWRQNGVACVLLAVPLASMVLLAFALPAPVAQILMQAAKTWL